MKAKEVLKAGWFPLCGSVCAPPPDSVEAEWHVLEGGSARGLNDPISWKLILIR